MDHINLNMYMYPNQSDKKNPFSSIKNYLMNPIDLKKKIHLIHLVTLFSWINIHPKYIY